LVEKRIAKTSTENLLGIIMILFALLLGLCSLIYKQQIWGIASLNK